MACGDIAWWREPDLVGLLERHGQAEHLAVQVDFAVLQPYRLGLAEFSIPGSSKSASGNTGYADIVSIITNEIWEIKPYNLESNAVSEATNYVAKAIVSCGPQWRLGTGYTTSSGDGVAFRYSAGGETAELLAWQAAPGAVLYQWRINGQLKDIKDPFYALGIRQEIIKRYLDFSLTPLPNTQPQPNDLPPLKWKPILLALDSIIPQICQDQAQKSRFAAAIIAAIRSSFCQKIMDGGAVAIAVESEIFDLIQGAANVSRTISLLQVKSNPTVDLYRQVLLTLTAVGGGGTGLVGAAIGGGWALAEVWALGAMVVAELKFVAGGIATAVGSLPAELSSFAASLSSGATARMAVASGASMLVFTVPRSSSAAQSKLASIRASVPMIQFLEPYDAQRARFGDPIQANGMSGKIIAIFRTPQN